MRCGQVLVGEEKNQYLVQLQRCYSLEAAVSLAIFELSLFRAHHVLLFDYCRNIGVGDMHPIATAIVDTIRDQPEP